VDGWLFDLFHNQDKINLMDPKERESDVGENGDHLALQPVEELFQLALVAGHP